MLAAAWEYGHRKLILMDSTFSVCLQKILLLVMLVIDENHRGVPVALFLFFAPLRNRQTSSIYVRKFIAYGAAIEKEGVQQEGETAEKEGFEGKEGKQMEKKGVDDCSDRLTQKAELGYLAEVARSWEEVVERTMQTFKSAATNDRVTVRRHHSGISLLGYAGRSVVQTGIA
ncbi:hypothetical protein BDK51DRAFT_28406 [Blyttiomyces helicus]|uniref:Uncharacterized protein n=1 Tax=Blyttiomyces helicus TaxID=388810 RepID=A0A4P9WLN5_9FUNG|nr:hypothetical protein BDK51DRAFT_28406 [Blyttiomyces helicus]|eukprot:RKO92993.1 hypothetical protein BDK51DRAFT_28406 [Blyttiomyces helicus]